MPGRRYSHRLEAAALASCLALGACADLLERPSGSVIREVQDTNRGEPAAPEPDGDALDSKQDPPVDGDELISDNDETDEPADAASLEECAVERQEAQLRPVYLLFLLDQSGSMGDGSHGQPELKWDPVSAALIAFFDEPSVKGVHASLTLFPPDLNQTEEVASLKFSTGEECKDESYLSPAVPVTELPSGAIFRQLIDDVTPPNEMRTPTRHALGGVLQQAERLIESDPMAAIAVVLVTDGEPYDCDGNPDPISLTEEVAAGDSDTPPVYVIGVGGSLESLNQIASAGRTHEAFLLPIEDPEQTTRFLLNSINTIHGEVIPCEAPIPAPPAGKAFEKEKVAVEYVIGGKATSISYDAACTTGEGWRYDNVEDPQLVQLCNSTCDTLQRLQESELRVVFACEQLLKLAK